MELPEEELKYIKLGLISLDKLKRISGPVSLYYYKFDNRNFYFFGDHHFSTDFNCEWLIPESQCSTVLEDLKLYYSSDECWDIVAFLKIIFERALIRARKTDEDNENNYIDFFLETSFKESTSTSEKDWLAHQLQILDRINSDEDISDIPKDLVQILLDREDDIYNIYHDLGYIPRIYLVFNSCFQPDKTQCPYNPYVRFHYADSRHQIVDGKIISDFSSRLFTIINSLSQSILDKPPSENVISTIITLSMLINIMMSGDIIQDIYRAYFLSSNFPITIEDIFIKQFGLIGLKFIELLNELEINFDVNLVPINIGSIDDPYVVRVHRIKEQLDKLREDNIEYNGRNIADLITDFSLARYVGKDIIETKTLWSKYFNNYVKPLRSKQKPLLDNKTIKEIFDVIDLSFMDLGIPLMDAYLLARMFRRFSQSEIPHIVSKNVITYTGSAHTDVYNRFFQFMLGREPILIKPERDVNSSERPKSRRRRNPQIAIEEEEKRDTERCVYDPYYFDPTVYNEQTRFYEYNPEKGRYVQDPNLGDYFPDL